MEVKVKKFNENVPDFNTSCNKSDWVDLYTDRVAVAKNSEECIRHKQKNRINDFENADIVEYKAGDILVCGLGVAMQLPFFCEAEIRPRSSTFVKYGLIDIKFSISFLSFIASSPSCEVNLEEIVARTENKSLDTIL